MSSPIVFLDVDGTLLPFGGRELDAAVGARLAALPCELVWATTWGEQANVEIGPLLGLPRLGVVRWDTENEPEDQWFGLHWKTRGLVEWAAGRPFAWLDDEISETDREWIRSEHSGPVLLQRVDAYHGVTATDLTTIERWLRTL